MDFDSVKIIIFERLTRELDSRLYYHGVHHTRDYVLPAAEFLAKEEGVDGESLVLLLTAVVFHDVGYLTQYADNEPVAVAMAAEILPEFGYNPRQIERITNIILATSLPQSPTTLLAEIMCDADLFHLGSQDFFQLTDQLWKELVAYGFNISELAWYEKTLDFLNEHVYFTQSAKKHRDGKKINNINILKERLFST